MALELPSDLIHQVKISTRTEAGLPDFNPDDPSLPSIPSLSATVAALDPSSPPHLRCPHCRGSGPHSFICIYCGHRLPQNPDRSSISFSSTSAYHWFLQALRLDGSEKVGAGIEQKQGKKGPRSPQDEVLLSDFLDIKIRWPAELETDNNNTVTYKKPEQSQSSYNSTGFNLDNFLSFPDGDIISAHKEQAVVSDNIGTAVTETVGTQEDFSLFDNLRSSSEPAATSSTEDFSGWEPAAKSSTVQNTDDFSGWEADFQSADLGGPNERSISSTDVGSAVGSGGHPVFTTIDTSLSSAVSPGNQYEDAKLTAAFVGSDIDLSAHLDTVFGTTEGPTDGKQKDVVAVSPEDNEWPAVDLWDNANLELSQKAGEILPVVRPDSESQNSSNNPSTSIDWFLDDTWQTHNAPKHDTTNGNHDAFDEWNTFASSAPIEDPLHNVLVQNNNEKYNNAELTEFSSNLEDMDFGSFSQSDPFTHSVSKESVSAEGNDNMLQVLTPFSALDTPSDVGDNAGHTSENADHGKSDPSKDNMDIEDIISQMHDLSFMLEKNLSIPSKSNSSLHRD